MVIRDIGGTIIAVDPSRSASIRLPRHLADAVGIASSEVPRKQLLGLLARDDAFLPLTCQWELLDRCNLRCPFCYIVGHSDRARSLNTSSVIPGMNLRRIGLGPTFNGAITVIPSPAFPRGDSPSLISNPSGEEEAPAKLHFSRRPKFTSHYTAGPNVVGRRGTSNARTDWSCRWVALVGGGRAIAGRAAHTCTGREALVSRRSHRERRGERRRASERNPRLPRHSLRRASRS